MKGKEAKRRLKAIMKAAQDADSLYGMDNNSPPDIVTEILAIGNGEACRECGDYRRDWKTPRYHYTHCSKRGQVL